MLLTRIRLAVALVVVGCSAQIALGNVGLDFRSPSGNVFCLNASDETGAQLVTCVALKTATPHCSGSVQASWTWSAGSSPSGRAKTKCITRRDADAMLTCCGRGIVLRYGTSLTLPRGRVRCTSRKTGITCRAPSGHSIFLSRQRVTIR